MLRINRNLAIPLAEIELHATLSSGPGGQNVNKVASAVQLRFDVWRSSLPEPCRQKLLRLPDRRIGKDGVIVIKAQRYRDQARNRQDALERLAALVRRALERSKPRIPTRPTLASKRKRLQSKTRRGQVKSLRGKVREEE